jgi:hypothetical protein
VSDDSHVPFSVEFSQCIPYTVGSPQTQQKKKTLLQRNIILVLLIKMVNYNYKKWFPSSDLTGKKPLLRYIINKNYARTISKDLTK